MIILQNDLQSSAACCYSIFVALMLYICFKDRSHFYGSDTIAVAQRSLRYFSLQCLY